MRLMPRVVLVVSMLSLEHSASVANSTICTTEDHSRKELRVVVPADRRQKFIDYLEAGNPNAEHGLRYVGGVGLNSDDDYTICFQGSNDTHIGVVGTNRHVSSAFNFWFQACNTTESWKPYWEATARWVASFEGAKLSEVRSK